MFAFTVFCVYIVPCVMPAYTKLNVSELREECDERGISYAGLNKKGIIALLMRDDESQIRQENNDVEDDGEEDEVQIRAPSQSQQTRNGGVMGQCGGDSEMGGNGGSDSSVALMQLKLELAREERERERERYEMERERREREFEIEKERAELGLNVAGQATAGSSRSGGRGDLCHLLPKMNDNDPLVFFSAFERSLTLNGIDRREWCRFLGACVTTKPNRVLAGLTLEENQDFDRCKQAILKYYRLDAAAYKKRFREARKGPEESFKMFKTRIHDYLSYYIDARGIDSLDRMIDDVVCE